MDNIKMKDEETEIDNSGTETVYKKRILLAYS